MAEEVSVRVCDSLRRSGAVGPRRRPRRDVSGLPVGPVRLARHGARPLAFSGALVAEGRADPVAGFAQGLAVYLTATDEVVVAVTLTDPEGRPTARAAERITSAAGFAAFVDRFDPGIGAADPVAAAEIDDVERLAAQHDAVCSDLRRRFADLVAHLCGSRFRPGAPAAPFERTSP